MKVMWVLLFTGLIGGVLSAEKNYEESFIAAVFEHSYAVNAKDAQNMKPIDILRENLKDYKTAVSEASKRDVDLLLFNEAGLSSYELYRQGRHVLIPYSQQMTEVTNPKSSPCDNSDPNERTEIFREVSCLAKKHKMYIVANMLEWQDCGSSQKISGECDDTDCHIGTCPEDGGFLYNTNVVFDRDGNLIAKYHKMHPYFESLNTPIETEYVTFDTEFGMFGTFICFDSVWKNAIELVENFEVEHVVFPFFWFEDEVTLSPVEWLQAWALTNKVNFLAANGHFPSLGTMGSGIFSKYLGALKYTFNPDGKSKLMVARVPRKPPTRPVTYPTNQTQVIIIDGHTASEFVDEGQSLQKYCLAMVLGAPEKDTDFRCFRPKTAFMKVKKLMYSTGSATVCQNSFCCSAKYTTRSMNEDYYLAVFEGQYDVTGFFHSADQSCLLTRCDPFKGQECIVQPFVAKTVFQKVELRAQFKTPYIYPSVSYTKNRLASLAEWGVRKTDSNGGVVMNFESKSNTPLLRVSLMSRIYDEDPPWYPYFGYSG